MGVVNRNGNFNHRDSHMKRLSVLTIGAIALSGCVVATSTPPQQGPYGGGGQPYAQPQPQPQPQPVSGPPQGNPQPTSGDPYAPPPGYQGGPGSGAAKGQTVASYPRVMIVIPEYHITRDKVPDPAAETEFFKSFKEAGYKLVDKKQLEKVWKDDVSFKLDKDEDVKAAAALAYKIGADILIIGEAFSEKGVETDTSYSGLPGQIVTANARVEVKAIRCDTAEILWADSETARGADTTEIIAGKKALADAGKKLAGRVSDEILKQWSQGSTQGGANSVEIELSFSSGKLSLAEVKSFKEGAMKSVAGLQEIVDREFAEGNASLEFVYEGDAHGLSEALDGKKIGTRVATVKKVTGNKIFVDIR